MNKLKLLKSLLLGLLVFAPFFTFASVFNQNLYYGITTTSVSSLQQFLSNEGLYSGPIIATFGPLTQKAVIAFQIQEGITPASGYFGPITRATAENVISAHPDWITTLSNTNSYINVNSNTIKSPAYSSSGVPAGATAKCRDGTYSFSLNRSGSCSHHGGVSQWLN